MVFEAVADVYVGIEMAPPFPGFCGLYLPAGHGDNPTPWPLIRIAQACTIDGIPTTLFDPQSGTSIHAHKVIGHEFGHLFGLQDAYGQSCSSSLMYAYASGSATQISAEDCAAIADLMLPPPPDPPEDPRHCARESGIDDCKASPILLDRGGTGIWFGGQSDAVLFDVTGDGQLELVNWVRPGGGAAFLVRDLNGNGIVDGAGELFGTATVMPDGSLAENGFLALAVLDEAWYGGNGDGKVSASDIGWYSLLVWIDSNANGLTEPGELQPLSAAGVLAIELDYRTLGRRDRHGNLYRYMSFFEARAHPKPKRRKAIDVFMVYTVPSR